MYVDNPHDSFWDCHETDSAELVDEMDTPHANCDSIEIWGCPKCGRRYVVELWEFESGPPDMNFYGVRGDATLQEIQADYR